MIKVVSYNMHKGVGLDRQRSPERILEVLRRLDADVVCLQEADRRFGTREAVIPPHLLAEHSPYKAVGLGMTRVAMGWHGNAVLLRREDAILDCERIHLPALEPRGAVMADLRVSGVVLRVVGMHLDLSGLWRRRQAAAILAHVAASTTRLPSVMMGDLNEWSAASGCLHDFARHFAFAATGPSFHARRPIGRLDRIMISPEWQVRDCGVDDSATARRASDHLPIWAVIAPAA